MFHMAGALSYPIRIKQPTRIKLMPLSTNVPRANAYIQNRFVLFDTCGFTWFAESDERMYMLMGIINTYRVLVPTPVMYELAFGLPDQVREWEKRIWKEINAPKHAIDTVNLNFMAQSGQIPNHGFIPINPGFNEWWSSRDRVIDQIRQKSTSPRNEVNVKKLKLDLTLDALIHATARNCFSPICTTNMRHFESLNKSALVSAHDSPTPLYTPEEVFRSIQQEVHFECPTI